MSFDAAAARHPCFEANLGGTDHRPPPEIRVDDEDGAAKLTPPDTAKDVGWTGDERRCSMPASHGRFVDEPYVFSLSQALALSGRRRSEPFMDTETRDKSSRSSGSPHRRVFVDQTASSGKHATPETWKAVGDERHSSVGASPKTSTATTATTASLDDELSRLQLAAGTLHSSSSLSQDSDEEQITTVAGSRFLSLPQMTDCLAVPARRHSVALLQPATSRILDVIAEETVAADSKSLAASRRYSLSCHLNS